ncbi:MAG: DUF5753 domain-containing protein [Pseudonocardiaceae bacterium]
MARGAARMQRRVGRIEGQSRVIRGFHPALIGGLLQIPDYARVIFSSGGDIHDVEESVAARVARQSVLDDIRKRFSFIIPESALTWHIGSPRIMAAQLRHVAEASRRRNVRLGVIPWTRPTQTSVTSGFDIYDNRAVIVGTETATAFLADRQDVDQYLKLFSELEEVASFDDEARQVLSDRADAYWNLH